LLLERESRILFQLPTRLSHNLNILIMKTMFKMLIWTILDVVILFASHDNSVQCNQLALSSHAINYSCDSREPNYFPRHFANIHTYVIFNLIFFPIHSPTTLRTCDKCTAQIVYQVVGMQEFPCEDSATCTVHEQRNTIVPNFVMKNVRARSKGKKFCTIIDCN